MSGFYANSAGRMGPNTYRDPPEPQDAPVCPECGEEGTLVEDGDRYDHGVECTNPECDYSWGWSHPDI